MGKKGRRGNDDWEKDFELDDDGELKALKEPVEEEVAAAGGHCRRWGAVEGNLTITTYSLCLRPLHQWPSHIRMTACCPPRSSSCLAPQWAAN